MPSGLGPQTRTVGMLILLSRSSALVSTHDLKLPSMNTQASYSSMVEVSARLIWDVFLPLPLERPITTVTAPHLLRYSAMSQMGWGM